MLSLEGVRERRIAPADPNPFMSEAAERLRHWLFPRIVDGSSAGWASRLGSWGCYVLAAVLLGDCLVTTFYLNALGFEYMILIYGILHSAAYVWLGRKIAQGSVVFSILAFGWYLWDTFDWCRSHGLSHSLVRLLIVLFLFNGVRGALANFGGRA